MRIMRGTGLFFNTVRIGERSKRRVRNRMKKERGQPRRE